MTEWFKVPVLPRESAKRKTWSRSSQKAGHAKSRKVDVMYYVYVLNSIEHDRLYVGSSAKPDERLKSHNAGRVKSIKAYRPWKRVFLEEHSDRNTAEKRERYLKSGWGRRWLKEQFRRDD